MSGTLNVTLRVWRQPGPEAEGRFVDYAAKDVPTDASYRITSARRPWKWKLE